MIVDEFDQAALFPGADDLQLQDHHRRDLRDLSASLKFTDPRQLVNQWRFFAYRLVRSGQSRQIEPAMNALLRGIYQLYIEESAIAEARLSQMELDGAVDKSQIQIARRRIDEQQHYRQQLIAILPQLRQLMLAVAQEELPSDTS